MNRRGPSGTHDYSAPHCGANIYYKKNVNKKINFIIILNYKKISDCISFVHTYSSVTKNNLELIKDLKW